MLQQVRMGVFLRLVLLLVGTWLCFPCYCHAKVTPPPSHDTIHWKTLDVTMPKALLRSPSDASRRLPGNDFDLWDGDWNQEEIGMVLGAGAVLLVIALVLCCCCCRRCSLWDIVACVCLWELCCGNPGQDLAAAEYALC